MAAVMQDHLALAADPESADRVLPIDRRVANWLQQVDRAWPVDRVLRAMLDAGLDRLPLPGHGATLKRWQVLSAVARHDLALVKLYEGHTDALAILAEIDTQHVPRPGAPYAVWASESRDDPLRVRTRDACGLMRVDGRKAWCSGAAIVDMALMTAVDADGHRLLVEVDLHVPGVHIDRSRWQAVGMHGSGSFDVVCEDVPARVVGSANAYLDRPGFWQGGGGIAACWFGAAAAIGTRVRDLQSHRDDVHALAHLGAIDGRLAAGGALLRECAVSIDAAPAGDAMRSVLRLRGVVAELCEDILAHAARAIGPGPLCNEPALARLVADLPIYIRQARAEHDLVAQARALLADSAEMARPGWTP